MAAGVASPPAPTVNVDEIVTPGWQHRAACRGDEEVMFPPDGRNTKAREAAETRARRICADCPVTRQCLATALARDERHGIWGGTTVEERDVRLRAAGMDRRRAALTALGRNGGGES